MTSDSKILSFEVFPPTTQVGSSHLVKTLDSLRALSPDFISVTCSNNNYAVSYTHLTLPTILRV